MEDLQNPQLLQNISMLLENARKKVVVTVNQTIVLTYFEIGRMIVEDERNGENRAEYGKRVLKDLSIHLITKFGRGFSEDNLGNMKNFFINYSHKIISETVSRKSQKPISQTLSAESEKGQTVSAELQNWSTAMMKSQKTFTLSWSHYLKSIIAHHLSIIKI